MLVMTTANEHVAGSNLLDKLQGSADLIDFLGTVVSERSLPSISKGNFDSLNQREETKIKQWSFGAELTFRVPVNLSDSKKAFNVFMAGLENHDSFTEMWKLCPHDPYNFSHPLGSIEKSTLKIMGFPDMDLATTK